MLKLLKALPIRKATGLDQIPCRLIKEAAPVIAESLRCIFNKSIETGIFPTEWKKAKMTPIYKANDKDLPDNYRPISVIPDIAKVFERIVFNQLYDYLSTNNLLSKYQSDFRPFHSTLYALLEATTEWFQKLDQGWVNSIVFLDLAKAFDTVDHGILISKLSNYGIKATSLEWFKSYLDDREQQCCVNGHLSSPRKTTCGVPQRSILGPYYS